MYFALSNKSTNSMVLQAFTKDSVWIFWCHHLVVPSKCSFMKGAKNCMIGWGFPKASWWKGILCVEVLRKWVLCSFFTLLPRYEPEFSRINSLKPIQTIWNTTMWLKSLQRLGNFKEFVDFTKACCPTSFGASLKEGFTFTVTKSWKSCLCQTRLIENTRWIGSGKNK